ARPLLALLPGDTTLRIQIEREFAKLVQLTPEELAELMRDAGAPAQAEAAASASGSRAGWEPPMGQDEPPGFMDGPAFEPEDHGALRDHEADAPFAPRPRPAGRRRSEARTVTPMAKRLLRLLLAHPELVSGLG